MNQGLLSQDDLRCCNKTKCPTRRPVLGNGAEWSDELLLISDTHPDILEIETPACQVIEHGRDHDYVESAKDAPTRSGREEAFATGASDNRTIEDAPSLEP